MGACGQPRNREHPLLVLKDRFMAGLAWACDHRQKPQMKASGWLFRQQAIARSERHTASGCNARSSGAPANAVVQETPPRSNSIALA